MHREFELYDLRRNSRCELTGIRTNFSATSEARHCSHDQKIRMQFELLHLGQGIRIKSPRPDSLKHLPGPGRALSSRLLEAGVDLARVLT